MVDVVAPVRQGDQPIFAVDGQGDPVVTTTIVESSALRNEGALGLEVLSIHLLATGDRPILHADQRASAALDVRENLKSRTTQLATTDLRQLHVIPP